MDRAVLSGQNASTLSPPHATWDSDCQAGMVTNLLSIFFLSEYDAGSSKAVVNGLAPGSHGQDKGRLWKRSLAWNRKAFLEGAGHVGQGPFPPFWGRHRWLCLRKPSSNGGFLRPELWFCSSWV